MAIVSFNRKRAAEYMSAVTIAAGPDKVSENSRLLKEMMFPEDALNRVEYVKKAKSMFDNIRKIKFTIKPIG